MKTITNHIILLLSLAVLIACSSGNREDRQLVAEWVGREIEIPGELQFEILSSPVAAGTTVPDFTILNYVDSSGCTSCRMKLKLWNETIDEFMALPDADIEFLTVVEAKDSMAINLITARDNYRHLVAIDSTGIFNNCNRLPASTDRHTFLLDSENRILVMGNPVTNPKIKEMYRSIITGSGHNHDDIATAVVNSQACALGIVHVGDTASATFPLRNDSDALLHVQAVVPSCDCTTATVTTTELPPHSATLATVCFVSDREPGTFNRYVDIFYEEKEQPDRLIVYGYKSNQ